MNNYKILGKKNVGIVLKNYGSKVVLFEEQRGRFTALVHASSFAYGFMLYRKLGADSSHAELVIKAGTCVSYTMQNGQSYRSGYAVLQELEIELVPLVQARKDIYFLHDLLELCLYFIPEGTTEPEIFWFIMEVLKNFENYLDLTMQKKILGKLFAHIGVYPRESCGEYWGRNYTQECLQEYVKELLKTPIDKLLLQDLSKDAENILDQWLLWCIQSHHQSRYFKALPHLLNPLLRSETR